MSLSLLDRPQQVKTVTPSEPLFSVVCPEKRGKVLRIVRRMVFTPENLNKFWEKSRQFPTLFNEEINGDFQKFVEIFLHQVGNNFGVNGLFWVVDDFVGVFYLTHIVPGFDAQVHYSFFDRCQNGREELVKAMLQYTFNRYQFHRLTAKIPCFAHSTTFNFAERVGFRFEGKQKQAAKYRGEWFDVKFYGMLPEYLNGNAD